MAPTGHHSASPVGSLFICTSAGNITSNPGQDIELKAVQELCDVHVAQTLTYLKLTDLKLGLLINFDEARLKHGLRRIVNNMHKSNSFQ